MIELPGKSDFHKTTNVEITQDENTGIKKIHYRKCNIAMRSITDFTSCEMEFEVIDEEKINDYEKQVEEFKDKIKKVQRGEIQIMEPIERPEPPTKKVKVIGTIIYYFNGAYRIVVDDFEEFEEIYFNYLTAQKLDLNKN